MNSMGGDTRRMRHRRPGGRRRNPVEFRPPWRPHPVFRGGCRGVDAAAGDLQTSTVGAGFTFDCRGLQSFAARRSWGEGCGAVPAADVGPVEVRRVGAGEDHPAVRRILRTHRTPACRLPGRDRRDTGQRTHDALFALLQPGLDPAELGSHRGLPVQATLTVNLADLERGAGVATTATGGHVSIDEVLKMAEGTRPVLAVLDADGLPLFLGRCQRLATPAQRLALIARDKGCTHPGCDAPASTRGAVGRRCHRIQLLEVGFTGGVIPGCSCRAGVRRAWGGVVASSPPRPPRLQR
ncbi:DUF222 domain-containing protein [Nocardia sp. NPDC101769]|uniref:DUF222 domain-containing protein n=1 Tax=Nocardia sp. NPDC101769 TaxID=3364333 RepID=UPI00380622CF